VPAAKVWWWWEEGGRERERRYREVVAGSCARAESRGIVKAAANKVPACDDGRGVPGSRSGMFCLHFPLFTSLHM
jgi:hypothetical protein